MGRNNKNYFKSIHQQLYERLVSMQAFGSSKKEDIKRDKENGTDFSSQKIYSFNTWKSYYRHGKYFLRWLREYHPDITTLKAARKYVNEWLQYRVDFRTTQGEKLSSWTIALDASSMNKIFAIKADDEKRFIPPPRRREDIKRSRAVVSQDKHFSVKNNQEFVDFCKATGLRRCGIATIHGKDLVSKKQLQESLYKLTSIPENELTSEEKRKMQLIKDAFLFSKDEYFIYSKEKGGRERISPIIGFHAQQVVSRFQNTPANEKVWIHVPRHADIHSYRSEYASYLYREYCRAPEQIPYDRTDRIGRRYKSEIYVCRKDRAGEVLDRKAMYLVSKALGHNRLCICSENYLRNL